LSFLNFEVPTPARGSVYVLGGPVEREERDVDGNAEERDGLPAGTRRNPGTLLETLARYERAHVEHNGELLRSCFHDDAVIESVASDGEPLGADATAELIRQALVDGVYSIREWQCEVHTPEIVLVTVCARHSFQPGGIADETVFRVVVGRDGLIWRARGYPTHEACVSAISLRPTPDDWV